jgi:hypothetical protein
MAQEAQGRSKFWWLWPIFRNERDARDVAKSGVATCLFIGAVSSATIAYKYGADSNVFGIVGGIFIAFIWCLLSYGIYRMSCLASLAALILLVADRICAIAIGSGRFAVFTLFLAIYLLNAVRATYWFKEKDNPEDILPKTTFSCEHCGSAYNLEDYSRDASKWLCRQCGKELVRH